MKMKIRLYNKFVSDDKNFKLSSIELYFYALLQTKYLSFMGYCETNIEIIAADQIVFKDTNERRKIGKVRDVIQELINRELLYVEGNINNRHERLIIRFRDIIRDGYELISHDQWMRILNVGDYRYLHVIFIIMKNRGVYELAKEKWSSVLGYGSKNTGSELVEKMENEGFIYKISGSRYLDENGQVRQGASKWYLDERSKEVQIELDKESKMKVRLDHEIIETVSYGELTVAEIKEVILDSNWGKKEYGLDCDLEYDDYEIFRISQDENVDAAFNKRCKNVINKIRKLEKYAGIFESWEEKYLREKIPVNSS